MVHHPLSVPPTHQPSPLLLPLPSLFYRNNGTKMPSLGTLSSTAISQSLRTRAVERESSSPESGEFKVDPEKARQALRKLDQQLLSLSQTKLKPPNITVTGKDLNHPQPRLREAAPDFSGSFLAYSAFVLLLFSIFYNVLFITVIKPSIDLPEVVEASSVAKAPGA